MEENCESVNQYDNEDVSMSIKAEPEVVFEVDESVNWTSGHYTSGNLEENDESNPDMAKSDDTDNDNNIKSPTLKQVIRKLDGLTKEIHKLKRILTHQNDMICNMITAQTTSHIDIRSMKESIKQQNNVISQVLPQQMGSLKNVLISHFQAPTFTKLFPVKTQYDFDKLENFINDENKSEIIAAVKQIINPKGLRTNIDSVISKDILLHYNLDGKFNKKRLLNYKNILDVLFLATYVEGKSFAGFVEELRHILRLVKNKHFKMICMEKKKLREETAIKTEPET